MSVEELVELLLARSYRRACATMNNKHYAFLAPSGLHYKEYGQVFFNGNERLARERDDMWCEYTTAAHRVADIGTCWRNLRLAQGLYCP